MPGRRDLHTGAGVHPAGADRRARHGGRDLRGRRRQRRRLHGDVVRVVIAVDTVAADDLTFGWGKLAFEHPPPSITVSDARGLLDGDPLTIELENWNPDDTGIFALSPALPRHLRQPHRRLHPGPRGPTVLRTRRIRARQRHRAGTPAVHDGVRRAPVLPGRVPVRRLRRPTGRQRSVHDGRGPGLGIARRPSGRRADGDAHGTPADGVLDGAPVVGQPTGAWTAYQCAHAVTRDRRRPPSGSSATWPGQSR